MPLENDKASTPKEARSSSTVTGGPTLLTPSPRDEGALSVAAAADAAPISPAGAAVAAEGDELLRRMQSVLEEDDSVDMLLPSLSAIPVLPSTGDAVAFGGVAAATQAPDTSGNLSGLLRCTALNRGSSCGDPTAAADDPDARSRNLGLGLAALHKLQRRQRLAQGQQQQVQQQRRQNLSDSVTNHDTHTEQASQHLNSQQKQMMQQQQQPIVSSSLHIGEPSQYTREASTDSSDEAKGGLAQQQRELQKQQLQQEKRQQQQDEERQQQQLQLEQGRGFGDFHFPDLSTTSTTVNATAELDAGPPAAAAAKAAAAPAEAEPPAGMEIDEVRTPVAATAASTAATGVPAVAVAAAEMGTTRGFYSCAAEAAAAADAAASGSCLHTAAPAQQLVLDGSTDQQERWPWDPPLSRVGGCLEDKAGTGTGSAALAAAASPEVAASAVAAEAGVGEAAELTSAVDGNVGRTGGTANLAAATAASLPPLSAEEEVALMAAGGLHGPEEAAVVAEAEAMGEFVHSLQQQLRQLQQQQLQQHQQGLEHVDSRPAAVEALGRIEERLRMALEAVDADVAALQREAAATAAATVAFASGAAEDPV